MRSPIRRRRPSGPTPAAPITSNETAQIAYWKGRAFLDRRDLTGNMQAALKEFERRDRKADPNFAMAHAGLAEAQWAMYIQTNDKTWAQTGDGVDAARARARTRSPERPLYRRASRCSAAAVTRKPKQELERALALQPTYEDAMRLHATVLMRQGKVDEGLAEFKKVMALRPNAVSMHSDMGVGAL